MSEDKPEGFWGRTCARLQAENRNLESRIKKLRGTLSYLKCQLEPSMREGDGRTTDAEGNKWVRVTIYEDDLDAIGEALVEDDRLSKGESNV